MEIFTWRGGRGKEDDILATANVLLPIVTEAHKMKPDLYQVCLQQQLLSQSFPFFLSQHPSSPVWGKGWISSVLLSTSSVVSYMISA